MHKEILQRFALIFTSIVAIFIASLFFIKTSFAPHLYEASLLAAGTAAPMNNGDNNLHQAFDHFFAWIIAEPLWELIVIGTIIFILVGFIIFVRVRIAVMQKQASKALQASEKRYRILFEQSPDPAILHNGKHVISANDAAVKLLKAKDLKQVLRRDLKKYIPPEDLKKIGSQIQNLLKNGGSVPLHEETWICLDDSSINVEVSASALEYKGERVLQLTARDITERKKLEEKLRKLAHFDQLTDLPNRAYLLEQLQTALKNAARYKHKMAVLFLDLNNFKQINDLLGHDVGDQLLKTASKRLRTCLRETDVLGRLGGDEFVIFLPEIESNATVQTVVHKISMAFQEPIRLANSDQNISTSIGISMFPEDGKDAHTLIKNADQAMYQSKKMKVRFVFFCMEYKNSTSRKIPTKA